MPVRIVLFIVSGGGVEFMRPWTERVYGVPPEQVVGSRRPVFGNSDGDPQMLRWTTAGKGSRLAVIVHHADAGREWAYDRQSPVGRLDESLDEAKAHGWTVVSMKDDWRQVFPR